MGIEIRIAQARKGAKLSQEALADALKVGQSTVASWERKGGNEPDLNTIERIAKKTGVEPAWLAFGGEQAQLGEMVAEVDARAGAGGGGLAVGEVNVRRGGGGSSTVSSDPTVGMWGFPAGYLTRELRAKPSASRVIELQGDSMAPTLLSGDRILVDTSQLTPTPPGLFALWDGLGIVAKRLEHIPNTDPPEIRIISDNARHEPYTRTADEVKVIGRILWFARRL